MKKYLFTVSGNKEYLIEATRYTEACRLFGLIVGIEYPPFLSVMFN